MNAPRERLKARRVLVGHTQETLAYAIGLGSKTTVARWEQGKSAPRSRHRPALATELKVSLGDLDHLLEEQPAEPTAGPPDGARGSAGEAAGFDPAGSACHRPHQVPSATLLVDAQHVAAALDNARYIDAAIINSFRARIATCASADGTAGPRRALPHVLELVDAVDRHARDVSPTARRQLLVVGARGAELLGWLYRDTAAARLADYWRDRAFEWAAEADDLPMCGYVLLKKSQAAWDQRDAVRMLSLAQAAQQPTWQLPARVRAEAAQQEARGHAMLGADGHTIDAKLGEAHEALASAPFDADDPLALAPHYDEALLSLQTAICHQESHRPHLAIDLYRSWLDDNQFSRRDYGYFLSLMASAFAAADDVREAAATALRAHAYATDTDSARTLAELRRLALDLALRGDLPEVRDLHEAILVA